MSCEDCASRLHQKELDANCYRYLEWLQLEEWKEEKRKNEHTESKNNHDG